MTSAISAWKRFTGRLWLAAAALHNALHPKARRPGTAETDLAQAREILARAGVPTDFCDHLFPLFAATVERRPRLIVELGTRGGESTFVLERAAEICRAPLVSVDIADCSGASAYAGWRFVRSDDIAFGQRFPEWCREQKLIPGIDVLFIDTSHEFEHTVAEIRTWFPWLSDSARVIFHDTNLRRVYRREDGTVGIGWNNHRGVIRALESFFGRRFDERRDFVCLAGGWLLQHRAICCGLTLLTRIPEAKPSAEPL